MLKPLSMTGCRKLTARVARGSVPWKGTLAVRIREALGLLFADARTSLRPSLDWAALRSRRGRWRWCRCCSTRGGCRTGRPLTRCGPGWTGSSCSAWSWMIPALTSLCLGDFRSRLIRHGLEERVLEAVLARLSGAGLLRAGGRQRTDSTHVLAAVRTLNRMEFAGETLRAALEALAAAAPGWLAPLIDSSWADRYGARIDSYRFPKGEDARTRWAGQVGRDGFVLLDAIDTPPGPGRAAAGPGGRGAAPRLGPAVPPGRGGGALAGGQRPPAGQAARPASPYDLDARYGVRRAGPGRVTRPT